MKEMIEQFYRDNYTLYVKRLSRRVGGPENAEDIVQEAFYRALKYADAFDPDGKATFEVWFNTVVRRAMYDFKRVELKQGMTSEIDSGETEVIEIDGVDLAMAGEIVKEIESKPLNDHRQVLYLAFVKDYPPRDIVKILDIGYSTVNTITNRFKREMSEKYGYNRQTKEFS